jgi:hypothetical protein
MSAAPVVCKHLILQTYRTFLPDDKRGGFFPATVDKAPWTIHHAHVIRADLAPLADPTADATETVVAPIRASARAK